MSEVLICPYCGAEISDQFKFTHYVGRNSTDIIRKYSQLYGPVFAGASDMILLHFCKCPECKKESILCTGTGSFSSINLNLLPEVPFQKFPQYIPQAIRSDYEEAAMIVDLSPKASATLCRRCLQGMIRDFWNIKKDKLYDAINELQDKIPASQWKAIDDLRQIGNIGAHMQKDVNLIVDIEPQEARLLLKLIEILLKKWYVERYDEENLFASISKIKEQKEKEKKGL